MSSTPSGRVLRQAPPQRVLYTPDVINPKLRPSSRYQQPYSPSASPSSTSPQPAQSHGPYPLSVSTPGNNPQQFQSTFYQRTAPANTFVAPRRADDLMNRIQMSFKSKIKSEEEWALGALLEVSFHNPEGFLLEQLPDITDFLLDTITEAPLFQADAKLEHGSLGQSNEDHKIMQQVLQSLLIIRNAVMNPVNAHYVFQQPECRGIVLSGLALPKAPVYSECRGYIIEIAEAVSFYVTPESPKDLFYTAMLKTLSGSDDRGAIIPSLRAISRLVLQDKKGILESLPLNTVEEILNYLLVDDEELISAALDFLYQYTNSPKNVRKLFSTVSTKSLSTQHLVRLLTYGIVERPLEYVRLPRRTEKVAPTEPPVMPEELVQELLDMNEPARATYWIRCSYEEDSNTEVTQISLWKAYESQFAEHVKNSDDKAPVLPGVDFINNVTPALKRSAAMVLNLPDGSKSYVIKGIKPREFAVTPAQLNAPERQQEVRENLIPSAFGITAVLVLANIARCKEGKEALKSYQKQIMKAMLLNITIGGHAEELLDLLSDEKPVPESEQKQQLS